MKVIASSERIKVPTNVKVSVRSRIVTVKGKRGTLRRSFRHLALDIKATNRAVTVTKYFGVRKELAAVRTVCSHIENMIKGVQFGYEYKMQTLHAHFPINVIVPPDGSKVSIKNFLGERTTRVIPMLPGVKAIGSGGASDTLLIQGNNIEDVSKCVLLAALIQQSCAARHKDIRKFLDGIYVSNRGTIEEMK
uniref:Large ribosomal subunit protein uL6 n=1 Tax=Echinococcus granulosus TaxID=6210 RepID=A0A068WJV4_ECHGR|nr:ribosomal protein L9 [Echinococcus granulosus]